MSQVCHIIRHYLLQSLHLTQKVHNPVPNVTQKTPIMAQTGADKNRYTGYNRIHKERGEHPRAGKHSRRYAIHYTQ